MLRCPRCDHRFPRTDGAVICPKCGLKGKDPSAQARHSASAAPSAPVQTGRPGRELWTHDAPVPGRLRQVSAGKTFLLGLLTLGIYYLVMVYKTSGDLHRAPGGNGSWQVFFWIGLIPYLGAIFMLILFIVNSQQCARLGEQRGVQAGYTPLILVFIPIANIAAPFVWAGQYNRVAARS